MKTIQNKILTLILAFVLCVTAFFMFPITNVAKADYQASFDDTDVLEDLESSKDFNILEYPYIHLGLNYIKVINVVEFCYSYYKNNMDNFALYLYVYNPEGINFDVNNGANSVQMAVGYNSDGSPNRYEKFDLKFCDVSTGAYSKLFYKFKVIDHESADGKKIVERVNSVERRYDISGIELMVKDNSNVTDYKVGGTYRFSGFAKGFGPAGTEESTLVSKGVEEFDTIQLDLHSTSYLANSSSKGEGHYNQVHTVYFSIPDYFFEKYGNLQKIRAQWYEYKTKKAVITSNEDFFNTMYSYRGVDIGDYNESVPIYLALDEVYDYNDGAQTTRMSWGYNVPLDSPIHTISCKERQSLIPLVFKSSSKTASDLLSFFYKKNTAGSVSSSEILDYIYNYSNNLGNGYLDLKSKKISKDLFENYVDDNRTIGFNDRTIDFDDTFDLRSYGDSLTWFEKLFSNGFSWATSDSDLKDIRPIVFLEKDSTISEEDLLINKNDIESFKTYHKDQEKLGNKVVLFRFANTDYFCKSVKARINSVTSETNTYIAQQTAFFDFDIIELTFNKDGTYYVIPVVASPIDIIGDFNPPPESCDNSRGIFALLLVLLLFAVLNMTGILPLISRFIILLVTAPFKLIKALFSKKE